MSIDPRAFRTALGEFATGVAIVSAEVDGVLLGATVSSFNSVSLDPPLVLFSLARSLQAYLLWMRATHFGVSVLSDRQDTLSNRFARGGAEKWAGIEVRRGSHGIPFPDRGIAEFECEIFALYPGGDHQIVVGRVIAFRRQGAAPLLFHGGGYRRMRADDAMDTPADIDLWWLQSW